MSEEEIEELDTKLHNIYHPCCQACSYRDIDVQAVKEVILPLITKLQENK